MSAQLSGPAPLGRNAREQRLAALQEEFHRARESGDRGAEIDALLGLGDEQYRGEDSGSAHMHYKLAERVIASAGQRRERMHEALGGRALVQISRGRLDEALPLLEAATAAAAEHALPVQQARWTVHLAGLHRRMKSPEKAREAVQTARGMVSGESIALAGILGGRGVLRIMADLEGEAALLAFEAGELEEAEDGYRRALDYSQAAGDDDAIATWGANVGRACRRRRRYTEALAAFEAAQAAAERAGNQYLVFRSAQGRAATLGIAHRHLEGGDAAVEASRRIENANRKCELLSVACQMFDRACAFERAAAAADELAGALRRAGAADAQIARYEQEAEGYRSKQERLSRRNAGGPKPLEVVIPEMMGRAEESGDAGTMEQMAHLICDVKIGLGATDEGPWQDVLPEAALRHRVVYEAVAALCAGEKGREASFLLQRYKSAGFASFAWQRLERTGPPHAEAAAYLDALRGLREAVEVMKRPAQPECFADTERVRAAGEAFLEAGELLRERDPVLLARLGGVLWPDDLLEALPRDSPVAIVDFIVGQPGTAGVVLFRDGNNIAAMPLVGLLRAEDTQRMFQTWVEAHIATGFGKEQAEGLDRIAAVLHDRMFCSLVQSLARGGITQLVLIPDVLTRHLPLHLARVCGKEVDVAGVDTAGARYLAEAMPVDYAPCVQAIASTQFFRRPRKVSKVVSLADARRDLPGARYVSEWLRTRLPDTLEYRALVGEQATGAAFTRALGEADVVLVGAHGHFEPDDPEKTWLEFADGSWTASELADKDMLGRSPMLVLSACETGAIAPTPDDRVASGMTGALVAAGAASVLASLWPVEDISMGYLIERFLTHLSYPGFRPSAALFRAVRDLVRLPKQDALDRCRQFLDRLEQDGTAEENPAQYIFIDNLRGWIEAHGGERPFSHPMFWGGVVISGSGWSSPAGAFVGGGPAGLEKLTQLIFTESNALALLKQKRPREAREAILKELPFADGVQRAKLLNLLACAIWDGRGPWTGTSARREALGLLARAERLADAEEDGETVARARQVRDWIQKEAAN